MAKKAKVKQHTRTQKGKSNTNVKTHTRVVKKAKQGGTLKTPATKENFYERMQKAKAAKAKALKKAARAETNSKPSVPSPQSL